MSVRATRFDPTVLGAASLLALAVGGREHPPMPMPMPASTSTEGMDLAGVWLSADGTVCLDLRPDGTYRSSVAGRRRSARGSYLADGTSVLLYDNTGLRTAVTAGDDELDMAGHRLYKV
jgi:hypothetical protein